MDHFESPRSQGLVTVDVPFCQWDFQDPKMEVLYMWSVPPMNVPEMALDFGDITEFVPSMCRITTNLRESHPTTSHLVFRIHIVYLCDFSGMTRTL